MNRGRKKLSWIVFNIELKPSDEFRGVFSGFNNHSTGFLCRCLRYYAGVTTIGVLGDGYE